MNITEHALDRMLERGFTPEMLGKFLNSAYRIETANDGRYKLIGVVDGVSWICQSGSNETSNKSVNMAGSLDFIGFACLI